jgi:hypothetical protein
MNNDGNRKQSLRTLRVELTGLELVRCLRAFVSARCDAVGLPGHDEFDRALAARPEDEEVFLAHLAEFRLRGDLMSLIAAKEFAHLVAEGDAPFTRQEEEA